MARAWSALAVAGALGLSLAVLGLRLPSVAPAAAPMHAEVPVPSSSRRLPQSPASAGPVAPPTPASTPGRVLPAVAGMVEVCGYGHVQLPPDDPDPVQRIPAPLRASALETMDALMLASDDVQVRAAALWMGARLRGREVRGRVEQMARMAVASQDPFVYALALEACKGLVAGERGSCELLGAAQWVRLDPDNAVPWQALAEQARAQQEPQMEDDALGFAARAPRSDVHAGQLPRLVDKALGNRLAPLQRTLALSAGWSADAVWSASHGVAVLATPQGIDLSCEGVERRQAGRLH